MKFLKKLFKKKRRKSYAYSAYNTKEAKANLKEAFEKRAKNKVKAEEIEEVKLDYKKDELEIKKQELEVKKAKLMRDKAIYMSEYEDITYAPEEEAEYEENGSFEEKMLSSIMGGFTNELSGNDKGSQRELSNDKKQSEDIRQQNKSDIGTDEEQVK